MVLLPQLSVFSILALNCIRRESLSTSYGENKGKHLPEYMCQGEKG